MIKDGKILLLENVSVDRNLPKYKDTNTANSVNNAWISVPNDGDVSFNSFSGRLSRVRALQSLEYLYSNKPFEKSCTILYI